MNYNDLIRVDMALAPLTRRAFEYQLPQNLMLFQWAGHSVLPICFVHENQPLEVGYLCETQGNTLRPVGRLIIDHTHKFITPHDWLDDEVSMETAKLLDGLRVLASGLKLTELDLELADVIADRFATDIRTRMSYLIATSEVAVAIAIALVSNISHRPYENVPDHLMVYIAPEVQRLNDPTTPSEEKKYIASYLNTVAALPWDVYDSCNSDAKELRFRIDQSHYGLNDIKDDLVSLFKLYATSGTLPMAMLLLGPPGTGKTSLIRSIARATQMKVTFIPMSGMYDTNQLLGFAKTYRDSQPGRIIKTLIQHKSMNPIIVLDEIDKTSKAVQNTLLHIIDPDHRDCFVDNYMGFPVDLSRCIFLCTANQLESVSEPLQRRLMTFNLPSYSKAERAKLIENYIFPAILEKSKLTGISLSPEAIQDLAELEAPGKAESVIWTSLARAHHDNVAVIQRTRSWNAQQLSTKKIGF